MCRDSSVKLALEFLEFRSRDINFHTMIIDIMIFFLETPHLIRQHVIECFGKTWPLH